MIVLTGIPLKFTRMGKKIKVSVKVSVPPKSSKGQLVKKILTLFDLPKNNKNF